MFSLSKESTIYNPLLAVGTLFNGIEYIIGAYSPSSIIYVHILSDSTIIQFHMAFQKVLCVHCPSPYFFLFPDFHLMFILACSYSFHNIWLAFPFLWSSALPPWYLIISIISVSIIIEKYTSRAKSWYAHIFLFWIWVTSLKILVSSS